MNLAGVTLLPGDVLCVDTGSRWGRWVKLGGLLSGGGRSGPDHIVVVHHWDDTGNLWGIEGRPGGVGWVELAGCGYRLVSTNALQPKTDIQRQAVCGIVKGLLQTPYDWSAIVIDAMHAIGDHQLWASRAWGTQAPGHVVCSSLADWAYERLELATPGPDRWVTPWEWNTFNKTKGWESP